MITNFINSKTISSRFSVSLIAGALRALIAFATAMLLARWFGPEEYGRIVFLLAAHIAIRQFLDMGISAAFFTFLSQRKRSHFFILVFWSWLLFQLSILVLLVSFILPQELSSKIWHGEERFIIFISLLASFMQGAVWQAASQMGEAIRETSRVQLVGLIALTIHLLLVILAWLLGLLSISLIFFLISVEWILASIYVYMLFKNKSSFTSSENLTTESFSSIFQEYKHYCIPLIPLAWLGATHDFGDRYMLQTWSGSKEQAYFGVATQLSAISLLVTTAILRIFWKEIAEAHEEKNYKKMGDLYYKISKMLFFCGAFLSAGMIPWSSEILFLTAGEAYLSGTVTFSLMLIYPIHQSLGQITNITFYATGRTKSLMYINGAFLLLGMGLTYLVLAPSNMVIPGYNFGSQGLAFKMIVMQFIFVNISSWVLSKEFGWKFNWLYQVKIISVCLIVSQSIFYFSNLKYLDALPVYLKITIFSIFYFLIIAGLVMKKREEVGIERSIF